MNIVNNNNIKIKELKMKLKIQEYGELFRLPTNEMFSYLSSVLLEQGYEIYALKKDKYMVLAPTNFSKHCVGLVAHVDTVGKENPVFFGKDFFFGNMQLDDRLGVFLILQLIFLTDLRPVLFFLDKEESGCLGAIELVNDFPKLSNIFEEKANYINCLIEVDRKGFDEVVFYDLNYLEFERLFEKNYKKDISFAWTDIVILGPLWDIAAANVSAGYNKEHTPKEYSSYKGVVSAYNNLQSVVEKISNKDKQMKYVGCYLTTSSLMLNYYNKDERDENVINYAI